MGLSLVVTGAEIPDLLPSLRDLLTPRQFEIAGCVRDGLENREIRKLSSEPSPRSKCGCAKLTTAWVAITEPCWRCVTSARKCWGGTSADG